MLHSLFLLRSRVLILSSTFIFVCASVNAQTKTTKYTYDSLGRATFVEDSVNGNRDYDYDQAGNRVAVVIGQATDDPVIVILPSPSSASCRSVGPGGWAASWSAVSGAHHYQFRNTNEVESTVSGTSISTNATCKWVKACDANNVCSAKTNF